MSSTVLNIIPVEPSFVPTTVNQDIAVTFLSGIYNSQQIKFGATDEIEFVDQGQNFQDVSCNLCGRKIEIEKWQDKMENAYETRFTNLNFLTSCCRKMTSLNDLNYNWPAGFSKFAISIIDPEKEVNKGVISELETILGTNLRIVWAHY